VSFQFGPHYPPASVSSAVLHNMNLARPIAVALAAASLAGCSKPQAPQEQCVRQMAMLWEACRSYHLEQSLPADSPVHPSKLSVYFRPRDQAMRCPLGSAPYALFSYRDGPTCPNSAAHTAALRAAWKTPTNAEPVGAPNRSQPDSLETNRISAAAGSGR